MLTWSRRTVERAEGIARGPAGREFGGREEWIQSAIRELRAGGDADRVGVWLETETGAGEAGATFRGELWDRDEVALPGEWTRLSTDLPIPKGVLQGEESVEVSGGEGATEMVAGPAMDLASVLWVPVWTEQRLRGLILLGRRKNGHRGWEHARAELEARKLELLLEAEDFRRLARTRQEDMELERRIRELLAEGGGTDAAFARLAEACAGEEAPDSAGAVFALIGELRGGLAVERAAAAANEERLELLGQSGDPAWVHNLRRGVLDTMWRRAAETGRMTGGEAEPLPMAKNVAQVVAIPLAGAGRTLGVLLAGIPQRGAKAEILERLEWRAQLASDLLERRKQSEEELRAHAWRRALLESSDRAVLLLDASGRIAGMSRGAEKLRLGFERDKRLAGAFPPREWERVEEWRAPREGKREESGGNGLRVEPRNGQSVELRKLPISGGEYAVVEIVPSAAGGAEQRTVAEAEAELRQTIEWLQEGVAVFDEESRIRAMNLPLRKIFGLEEDEVLHSQEELIERVKRFAADPESFPEHWAKATDPSLEGRDEIAMERPLPQVIERSSKAIVGEQGKYLGRVEVYREMTARKLFQSRMVQTEKLASLGQRVTGIVHELSNPLTTILGIAQRMALRGEESSRSGELPHLLEEAERAVSIVRQLLQVSREGQTQRGLVSLRELIERTTELQRLSLSGSEIRLRVECGEGLPGVEGDFGQLQQVLLNLLQNAQHAIEQSGRGKTIGVRTELLSDGMVRLEVWDDGPGIPAAIQARIFDPFFTTKVPGVGTGLGLSIVRGFVRQHGGTVTLVSPPQGGSRFVVELPAASSAKREEASARLPSPIVRLPVDRTATPAEGRERTAARILVVEDEPTVAALISDVLRDEGLSVDVLLDSEAALRRAAEEEYDLLICDLKMPGVDGQMLYRSLVKQENRLSEHVLFVTGDVMAQRSQEFLERNRLHHVAKPFRVDELLREVKGLLGGAVRSAAPQRNISERAMGNG